METLAFFSKPAERPYTKRQEDSHESSRARDFADGDEGLDTSQKVDALGEKPFQCISCKRGPPHIKKYAKNQCQTCYKKDKKIQKDDSFLGFVQPGSAAKYNGFRDSLRRPEERFARGYEHDGSRRVPESDFNVYGGYGARTNYGPDRRFN